MKLVLITIILFTTFTAWAKPCKISVFPKIYTIRENTGLLTKEIIKKSDCKSSTNREFIKFLTTTKGVVSAKQLTRMFKSMANKDVQLTPSKISIYKLEDFLTERIAFSKSWFVKEINTSRKNASVVLDEGENLHVDCPSCNFPGSKSIRVVIQNPIKNTNRFQMLSAKVLIKTIALVPRGVIQVDNLALSSRMFKEQEVYVDNPAHIFTNKKALVFYKVNKPLTGEKALLLNDLVSISIVKAGTPVNILLSHDGISLSSTAIPLRSGKFGDVIQLRSSRSKKIIVGKVIDYNKVAIEL